MTTTYIKLDIELKDVLFQVVNPDYEAAEPDVGYPSQAAWERIQLESDPNGTDLTPFFDDETLNFFYKKVIEQFEN